MTLLKQIEMKHDCWPSDYIKEKYREEEKKLFNINFKTIKTAVITSRTTKRFTLICFILNQKLYLICLALIISRRFFFLSCCNLVLYTPQPQHIYVCKLKGLAVMSGCISAILLHAAKCSCQQRAWHLGMGQGQTVYIF